MSVLVPRARLTELVASDGAGAVAGDVESVEKKLTVSSGAGKATVRVRSGDSKTAVDVRSGAGSVLLTVPPNVIGDFDLETGVGTARAPAALGLEEEDRFIGGRLFGKVGAGRPKIRLSSTAIYSKSPRDARWRSPRERPVLQPVETTES